MPSLGWLASSRRKYLLDDRAKECNTTFSCINFCNSIIRVVHKIDFKVLKWGMQKRVSALKSISWIFGWILSWIRIKILFIILLFEHKSLTYSDCKLLFMRFSWFIRRREYEAAAPQWIPLFWVIRALLHPWFVNQFTVHTLKIDGRPRSFENYFISSSICRINQHIFIF